MRQASLLLPLWGLVGMVPVVAPLQAAIPIEALPASCQILEASGLPQISPAAIDFLERCLSRFPQTNSRDSGDSRDQSNRESLLDRIIAAAGMRISPRPRAVCLWIACWLALAGPAASTFSTTAP